MRIAQLHNCSISRRSFKAFRDSITVSMLSLSTIHLWKWFRYSSTSHPVAPWKSLSLQRRLVALCSQGTPFRLDSDDVKIGLEDRESGKRKVSLRSPAPLPEGTRADYTKAEPVAVAAARKNSFERFVMARARTKRERLVLGAEDEEYYTPVVSDHVMGIVVSGTFASLDVDIGAKELGHLFRKELIPLDFCNVREMAWEAQSSPPPQGICFILDEEALNLTAGAPLTVEVGTVLAMEVKGMTLSGRASLSARSVAREYAWQRVRQLLEYNAALEVQITEWTTVGLVAKIEGLRAFLPTYYLVNDVREPPNRISVSYKDYVGQKYTVMISSIDEQRSNLVISEKKAWMAKNAYIGALVEGIVSEIKPYGVHLRIMNTDISGVLHVSNMSRGQVNSVASLFSLGEEVKAMVVPSDSNNRLSFSTANLETTHGLILRDREAVFQDAERIAVELAEAYKTRQSNPLVENNEKVEVVDQDVVIANWDWLDFDGKVEQE